MSETLAVNHAGFRENLEFLSRNLRYSWHRPTWDLFARLDPEAWRRSQHNPVKLLHDTGDVVLAERAANAALVAEAESLAEDLRGYLAGADTWYGREHGNANLSVAYFSAEFAVTECLHIFSGGLGVLAGDHLKSASDLGVPLVAVGLLYREGYFQQEVDAGGVQRESYPAMNFEQLPLTLECDDAGRPLTIEFPFADRTGRARIWRADVGRVPLYLLDTDIPENGTDERRITDRLYGGDSEHRLQQEIVLGIGGVRALAALGIEPRVIHLNEGHAAFAAVERVRESLREHESFSDAAARVAERIVFTTHTPVPAGHDFFAPELMQKYLGGYVWELGGEWDRFLAVGRHDADDAFEPFNMTLLALRTSSRRNGVSELHGEVSRRMWRGVWEGLEENEVPIGHITNGVHLATWVAEPMASLYDRHIGAEWRDETDQVRWRRAAHVLGHELWATRTTMRTALVERARRELKQQLRRQGQKSDWADEVLDPHALTIVFARRFATYKRATLLLGQPERLKRLLLDEKRPVQFIFAGKAHPRDEPGKEFLRQIQQWSAGDEAVRRRFVFLEGYDVELARFLVSGADVWLNVPRKPYEASGTSGMKAAANGGLNLSIPDGWWAEAWHEHNHLAEPPGWSIEARQQPVEGQDQLDADALFALLEEDVIPLFYERDVRAIPNRWCERIRATMRELVPFFNTHRMVQEYTEQAYLAAHGHPATQRPKDVAAAG